MPRTPGERTLVHFRIVVKKVVAAMATVTVLAVGSIAVAGAVNPTRHGGHRHGQHRFHSHATLGAAAASIGVSYDSLREAMRHGQTIATIAGAHHVDPNEVVAAMVAVADRDFAAKVHRSNARYRRWIPAIMHRLVFDGFHSHHGGHRHHVRTHAARA